MRFINSKEYYQVLGNIQSYVAYGYFSNESAFKDLHWFLDGILPNPSNEEYLSFYVVPFDTIVSVAGDTLEVYEFNFGRGYVAQPKSSDVRNFPSNYYFDKPCDKALIAKSRRAKRLYFISGYFFLDDSQFIFKNRSEEWNAETASSYVAYRFHNWDIEVEKVSDKRLIFYSKFYQKSYQVVFDDIDNPIEK